ncbi:hypothetical protein AOLI_G00102250 [Acnodon oligacanthus]
MDVDTPTARRAELQGRYCGVVGLPGPAWTPKFFDDIAGVRRRAAVALPRPGENTEHDLKPGVWIFMKDHKRKRAERQDVAGAISGTPTDCGEGSRAGPLDPCDPL